MNLRTETKYRFVQICYTSIGYMSTTLQSILCADKWVHHDLKVVIVVKYVIVIYINTEKSYMISIHIFLCFDWVICFSLLCRLMLLKW